MISVSTQVFFGIKYTQIRIDELKAKPAVRARPPLVDLDGREIAVAELNERQLPSQVCSSQWGIDSCVTVTT